MTLKGACDSHPMQLDDISLKKKVGWYLSADHRALHGFLIFDMDHFAKIRLHRWSERLKIN